MDEYPPNTDTIDETDFDVIIQGTGLEESLIAGSLARSGLKVLHLDDNSVYGGSWGTLTLKQFLDVVGRSGGKLHHFGEEGRLQEAAPRGWNIDLTPRGVASGGAFVDMLIESNSGRYLEFKNLDRNLIYLSQEHGFVDLPSGRAEVFKTKNLAAMEKRRLMQMMQYCDAEASPLPEGMASRPVSEFLRSHLKMNDKLFSLVMFSLLGQSTADSPLDTASALEKLRTLGASVGRYGPTNMLYPNYGVSELCQSMCRVCAIYRGVYILRRKASEILVEESPEGAPAVSGVRCNAGQVFTCKHFVASEAVALRRGDGGEEAEAVAATEPLRKEHRAVVISNASFFNALPHAGGAEEEEEDGEAGEEARKQKAPYNTVFATLPPGALGEGLPASAVQLFEVSYSTASCPKGYYCLHLTQAVGEAPSDLESVVSHFIDPESGCFREAYSGAEEVEGGAVGAAALTAFFTSPTAMGTAEVAVPGTGGVEGVYQCGATALEADVDGALERAKAVFRSVMLREVGIRGEPKEEDEKAKDCPFDPHTFFPPLPDPEGTSGADDPESVMLGVAVPNALDATKFEDAGPAGDTDEAVPEEGAAAVQEEGDAQQAEAVSPEVPTPQPTED